MLSGMSAVKTNRGLTWRSVALKRISRVGRSCNAGEKAQNSCDSIHRFSHVRESVKLCFDLVDSETAGPYLAEEVLEESLENEKNSLEACT
jgi:hypothetical protein